MQLMSLRTLNFVKTKMKPVKQLFTNFSLLGDVTMTSLSSLRDVMLLLEVSIHVACTVTVRETDILTEKLITEY